MKSVATESKVTDKRSFDVQTVEHFFSHHFTENTLEDLEISPSLAIKKIQKAQESCENLTIWNEYL